MPDCLIISSDAADLAREIERISEIPIETRPCISAEQAVGEYGGETILFGQPAMIAQALPEMPGVDWVQSSWAGVEPLLNFERRDYRLTGIKGVFGPQMSEYVFGHLLAFELRLSERAARQQNKEWYQARSGTLHGKRLGIMGTGSIGRHIARTARAFGMTVSGLSRTGEETPGFDSVEPSNRIDGWLGNLDYLVATLPRTPQTNHLLNEKTLALLPAHCFLVNVGRSNVLDEAALVDALRNRRLGGAALDVFEQEPLPEDSPLWHCPGLSITAHISAISHPGLIAPIFVENYRRYRAGLELKYRVDFEAGY